MLDLRNMDCMDLMREYPDKHFELAIVDPPYGISINMNMGRKKGAPAVHKKKNWDNEIPSEAYFEELFRVSKNQVIWGGNYFPLPLTKSWVFWDKQVPKGVSFADGELAWTSFDKTLIKVTVPYSGFQGCEGKIHPTQKPVKLYKEIISLFANRGDKILDTFLGSGSIAIACHQMGFDLTGSELDKDYFEAMQKRIKEETAQLDLLTA